MPELPEVETIREQLKKKIAGKSITGIVVKKENIIKQPSPQAFKKRLLGQEVVDILREGKALVINLKRNTFLVIHLRIAGWLTVGSRDISARAVFELSDGNFLNYMDRRLLGELRLVEDYRSLSFIKSLGPDALKITLPAFKKILGSKGANIKSLLMNQNVIAGIGNIYAQEALFSAGVDPRRSSRSLKEDEVKALYNEMRKVLKEGIKHKGSSVDSYRDTEGNKGGMERRLRVYGREGKACFICRTPVKKITVGGRGTCFCPKCQK